MLLLLTPCTLYFLNSLTWERRSVGDIAFILVLQRSVGDIAFILALQCQYSISSILLIEVVLITILYCLIDISLFFVFVVRLISTVRLHTTNTTTTTTVLQPFVQNHPDEPVPERLTILVFTDFSRDDGMAVSSAGPYASHLHFAPGR